MALRILAVGDPAVYAYTNSDLDIVASYERESGEEVFFDILPWEQYTSTLFEVAPRQKPPYDVVMIAGHLWLPRFVEEGWLASLAGLAPLESPEYNEGDILPAVRREMRYRDEPFLVPSFTDGHLLYSRVGLAQFVDERGFVDPRNFAGVAPQVGDRFTVPMILKAAASEIFLDWLPYLRAFGGDFLDPEGAPGFDNRGGREALAYYLSLKQFISRDHAPWGNEEVAGALKRGEVAFGVSWGGQAGVIAPEATESAELTYATLTEAWNVTWSFGILAGSDRRERAAEFLAWITSGENDAKVGAYAGSPVRSSTYDDEELVARCPWFPAQRQLLETAVRLPSRPGLPDLLSPIYEKLAAAFAGDLSPEDALRYAAREIRQRVVR